MEIKTRLCEGLLCIVIICRPQEPMHTPMQLLWKYAFQVICGSDEASAEHVQHNAWHSSLHLIPAGFLVVLDIATTVSFGTEKT